MKKPVKVTNARRPSTGPGPGPKTTGPATGPSTGPATTGPSTGPGPGPTTSTGPAEATGTADETGEFFDPTEGRTGPDTGSERRGRGRPRGSTGSKARQKIPTSLEGIEGILLSLHFMLASFTKISELELSEGEAKKLAVALDRVASLYDVGATEKTMAWTNLAMCIGGVYGTRAYAYSIRVKAEAAAAGKKDNVLHFSSSAASGQ